MRGWKRIWVALLVWLAAGIAVSGENSQELHVDVDYAHFRANEFENFVEVYYALYPSEWKFVPHGDDSLAQVVVRLSLFQGDSLIQKKAWRVEQKKSGLADPNVAKFDLIRYQIQPGDYRIEIQVEDANDPKRRTSTSLEISNQAFPKTQLSLSDLQLCRSIRQATEQSPPVMVKNGLEVIPNPGRFFGSPYPVIFFYVEIYNLQEGIKGDNYTINYFVTDLDGKKVDGVREHVRTRPIKGNRAVEIGIVNISKLPSGTYWLYFAVTDSAREHLAYTRSRFYCYNPGVEKKEPLAQPVVAGGRTYSVYERMAPIQIENELKYIRYIATKSEMDVIRSLKDLDAKKQFLVEFWRKRDPKPETPENEYRREYLERVRYANQHFSGFTEGWQTDFGRVYILYGPPSNVERVPSSPMGRAYQIWTYDNLQGGVEFVFIDFTGYQQYELVHSTYRGEIENWEWRKLLELNYQRPPDRRDY